MRHESKTSKHGFDTNRGALDHERGGRAEKNVKSSTFLAVLVGLSAVVGCGSPNRGDGTSPSGGTTSTGGISASGGSSGGSGGGLGSGGITSSGGTTTQGGSGGTSTVSTAGSGSGGSGGNNSGGTTAGSGGNNSGGTTAAGGNGGSGGTNGGSGGSNSGGTAVKGGSGGGNGGSAGAGGTTRAGGTSGSGGTTAAGGSTSTGGSTGTGPCDIYQSGNTPCVAAHSMVRALYAAYTGNLYQVRRASDKTTKDIPLLTPGGFVNSSVQDSFCSGTTCTISYIYDQSPQKNDLPLSPPVHWLPNGGKETKAASAKITISGHVAYGIYVEADAGNTYRNNAAKNVPKGTEPESMYAVVDAKRYNGRCCFDYGNVETSGNDDGNGTMETLEYGNITNWGSGGGNGPWVGADLENGVFYGASSSTPSNTPVVAANFATLMLRGYTDNHMILKAGDAQTGKLETKWDGKRPVGYDPMKKQGAVELGTGGDGSAGGIGNFFEGAIAAGLSTDAIDDAIQANIIAAGYGK